MKICVSSNRWQWLLFSLIFIFLRHPIWAHEPLFGLGPHVVAQYQLALESEFEKEGSDLANHLELAYGLTPNVGITFALPYHFTSTENPAGIGNLNIRGKYRFYRQDKPGASLAFAVHAGGLLLSRDGQFLKDEGKRRYFLGLSFGYESRRHYAFAGIRYLKNGNQYRWRYDAAYGIRPWKLEYHQPDLVLLLEWIGENRPGISSNIVNRSFGRKTFLSTAPGFLFSIRNVMLKGGIKIPINFKNKQETEYVFGLEIHLPPFQ